MDEQLTTRLTSIPGVSVVETTARADHRGAFTRLFCRDVLREIMGSRQIVQVNHSRTRAVGAVRGMHYQRQPHAEMKLVRCLKGKIWDVAVDLRANSLTLLQWHGEELSAENGRMLIIPEGCAHGFQVLEEDSELLYLHTAFYIPASEGGIQPNDPKLAIRWPLPIRDLSERDLKHPLLTGQFTGLMV
jgi:dTDP-4-dehydrorhamnose 3,5-epimerase